MNSALMVNAYSVGNRGDAAIAEGLIFSLRRAGYRSIIVCPRNWQAERDAWIALGADDVVPSVLSIHDVPAWAAWRPLKAAHTVIAVAMAVGGAIWPRLAGQAVDAYHRADLVVAIGGAYLGGPKLGVNLVKTFNIGFARLVRRPVVVAPMTVNPARWPVTWLLRQALRGAAVFVRDEPSARRLAELGIRATLVPDLAFRATSAVDAARDARQGRRGNGALTLGWSPREYRRDHDAWGARDRLEASCIEAVTSFLAADSRRRLTFIPQVTVRGDDDRTAISRLMRRLPDSARALATVATPPGTPGEAVRQFARTDILLSSRMHAALLAMLAGVPAAAIGYEPKVAGVFGWLGLADRVIPPDGSWPGERIAATLESMASGEARARTVASLAEVEAAFAPFDAALGRYVGSAARRS